MAFIYQSNVETGADLSMKIIVRQGSHVIHEVFISQQSRHKNDQVLIYVAPENHHHLKAAPLDFTTWSSVIQPRRETSPSK